MNFRKNCNITFRKWAGGGSRAVWNFSENSSVLEGECVPLGGGKALKDGSDDYGGHIPCLISICMFVHINRWRVWPCRLCNKSVIELQFITFWKCPMCFTSASLTWPVIWRPICAKFWVAASVWVVHITPGWNKIVTGVGKYHHFPLIPQSHVRIVLLLHWPIALSISATPTSMIGFLCI